MLEDQQQHQHSSSSPSAASTLRPSSHSSTLTRAQVEAMVAQLTRSPPNSVAAGGGPPSQQQQQQLVANMYREKYHEQRLLYPVMKKSGDLGVRLVGGNAVGIFIHSVDMDSPAYNIGLRSADQILEYNGTDLRQATAEQAAYELAKPADSVAVLVQYNPDRYNAFKDQPGDAYYIRAMFDRQDGAVFFSGLNFIRFSIFDKQDSIFQWEFFLFCLFVKFVIYNLLFYQIFPFQSVRQAEWVFLSV